jgi:hypothetical protein
MRAPNPFPAPPPNNTPIMAAALGTLRDCSKSSVFWILFATFFICGASTNGLVQVHLDPDVPRFRHPAGAGRRPACRDGHLRFLRHHHLGLAVGPLRQSLALFWYYGLRGLSLLFLPFTDFTFYGLSLFAVFYGLDWIATVPPTVR